LQKSMTILHGLRYNLCGKVFFKMKLTIPIAQPPWTALGKKMESAFRKALYEYGMLKGVDKVAIALSGGKDSLTLLYLLHAINGKGFDPVEIIAVHVDGEFSCGAGVDGNYLRAICERMGVRLIVRKSKRTLENLECYSCSRERRKLIFESAKEEGCTTIAFGHHRDDMIQTLLLNLLHKGEFAANLAKLPMKDFGITIIRPLTYITEDEIRSFAHKYGFQRITCQCPVGQDSKRKRVEKLLAEMEREFPNARSNLAWAAKVYGSEKAKRS